MPKRFWIRKAGGLLVSLVLLGGGSASAFPSYGNAIDSTCTANGWIPARPYAGAGSDCGLCHANASNPGSSLTAAGDQYRRSAHTDVTPFCSAPTANEPPRFESVAAQSATVGALLELTVRAMDPDGDALLLSVANAPTGSTFDDRGDGSGLFRWTPTSAQLGAQTVTFHAADTGSPMAVASIDVSIAVGQAVNRPPVLEAIGNQQLDPGQTLAFTLSAADPEGQPLVFSATALPTGATLLGPDFVWTPDAGQIGQHSIVFRVTDTGSPAASDSETVVVTVGRINRPPVLSSIGSRQTPVGTELRIGLTATDPDADPVALVCMGLPDDAVFTEFDDGTAEIVWLPTTASRFTVTCTATDTGAPPEQDSETFTLSAVDAPVADRPLLEAASWRTDRRDAGRLVLQGMLPTRNGDVADGRAALDVFAVLSDGAPILLGTRTTSRSGRFRFELHPFVAPCAVAVAQGGSMSDVVDVVGAPSGCDTRLLTRARSVLACDGATLVVTGARGPVGGRVEVDDVATGSAIGSFEVEKSGRFGGRVPVGLVPSMLELRAEVDGMSWSSETSLAVLRPRHCARGADRGDDDEDRSAGHAADDDEADADEDEARPSEISGSRSEEGSKEGPAERAVRLRSRHERERD